MFRHRLAIESDIYRVPAPRGAVVPQAAWIDCPAEFLEGMDQEAIDRIVDLYEQALEDAAAILRPSILERNLFACPN
ncbi:hypothetical protein [Tuwongella immobilis]|uniref:hypothetical protein n=1 Tax=Tuwongella immobilis TaxID=692036 RepID=UPI0013A6F1D4|nr:hypothetical protein [Tuwongella immobilis]